MPIAALFKQIRPPASRRRGYTLIELTVVMGVISVLLGLVLAMVALLRSTSQATKCMYNLSQIGNAFRQYALDNNLTFPTTPTDGSWEKFLSNVDPGYLGNNPDLFRCPADYIVFSSAVKSSYDWRDTGDDSTTIAGKALTNTSRSNYVLAFETFPGNHTKKKMNAVLADGSTLAMDQEPCMADLTAPLRDGVGSLNTGGTGGGVLNSH